jgi:hypothetical protein
MKTVLITTVFNSKELTILIECLRKEILYLTKKIPSQKDEFALKNKIYEHQKLRDSFCDLLEMMKAGEK